MGYMWGVRGALGEGGACYNQSWPKALNDGKEQLTRSLHTGKDGGQVCDCVIQTVELLFVIVVVCVWVGGWGGGVTRGGGGVRATISHELRC